MSELVNEKIHIIFQGFTRTYAESSTN